MKQISAALVKAQREFEPARKTANNPHFRSKYADLATCVEAVIDALNNNDIYLMQANHECPDGVIVETMFIHSSGESLSAGKLHVPAPKQDPQGYGSALTYARRYSLLAACGIAPEDDDGNLATDGMNKGKNTEPPSGIKAPHITEKQAGMLKAKMREAGVSWDTFSAHFGIAGLSDLTMGQMDEAINFIADSARMGEP